MPEQKKPTTILAIENDMSVDEAKRRFDSDFSRVFPKGTVTDAKLRDTEHKNKG